MAMIRALVLLVVLAFAASGCSMSADTAAAEQGVTKFHAMLDAGQFEQIYDGSSSDLKSASTRENLVALLAAVHRKLGNTKSSTQNGWKVNFLTKGTYITLAYKTIYAEGEADEVFVFVMGSPTPLLAGYHVNSNTLIIK